MAALTQIGTSNISLADVRDTLTSNGGTATNELKSFFQTSTNINKWSKFKPVHYPADFLDSDLRWQGYGTCGFLSSSIIFSSDSALVTAYKNGTTYQYQLPTGTASSPYRLGDFRGYYPAAKAPIWSFETSGQIYANDTSSSASFTILGNGDVDTSKNLTMKDIMPDGSTALSSYYFGVIVTNTSGTVLLTSKASSTIGTSASFTSTVTVAQSSLSTAGNYIAYPALLDATGKTFVALPIGAVSFSVLTSKDTGKVGLMTGSGYYQQVGGKKTFGAQISYTKSWAGYKAQVEVKKLVDGTYETVGSIQTITLPTSPSSTSSDGNTYYYDYSFSATDYTSAGEYYMYVYWGSNYENTASIILTETTEPL